MKGMGPFALLALVISSSCVNKLGDIKPRESIFADTMVDMTWQEVRAASEKKALVLLPVAVVEEHGPQLDLSPDIYQTCLGCRYIKRSLEGKGYEVIIAPPYYWGMSEVNKHIPGAFSVKADTFKAMLRDIAASLQSWGFAYVFSVNLHGDPTHNAVLGAAMEEIRKDSGMGAYDLQGLARSVPVALSFPPRRKGAYSPDYHAGASETAAMNAFYPSRVRRDIAAGLKPESYFDPLGYVGDPASYKLEKSVVEISRIQAEGGALVIDAFMKKEKAGKGD